MPTYSFKIKPFPFALALSLFSFFVSQAQYLQVNDSYTPQQLVEDIFIGADNLGCVQVSNVSMTGFTFSDGRHSYGYFTGANTDFAIQEGVVLSTGKATSVTGPNHSLLSEGPGGNAWPGDALLEQALNLNGTVNATILEFDFVANFERISFDYIFSSEQYLTSITSQNQCNYTDGFAFLIKRTNVNEPYTNLAVIPNTNIPVTVNTVRGVGVCPSANEQYFDSFNEYEHPTNFNGQTKVLTAQSEILPGVSYHIRLVIADQGNNLYDSAVFLKGGSFGNAKKELNQDRIFANGNPLCDGESFVVNATTQDAVSYEWYRNEILIPGETNPTLTINQEGDYQVWIDFGGGSCVMKGDVKVEVSQNPQVMNVTLVQCDYTSSKVLFNLHLAQSLLINNPEDYAFTFFESLADAQNNQNAIPNPTQYLVTVPNQVVYARVENEYGCTSVASLQLSTANGTFTNPTDLEECATETGTVHFDLTQNQDEISAQITPTQTFAYYTSFEDALTSTNPLPTMSFSAVDDVTTIYVKITENGNCVGILWFDLIIRYMGAVDTQPVELFICEGDPITITAPSGFYNYSWNTGATSQSLEIAEGGDYTVTFYNEYGCEASKTFVLAVSSVAIITDVVINDLNSGYNTVTVLVEGQGDYEYSLNGITYQDSNVFTNVSGGQYMVSVRDKNGCGTAYESIFVLEYPKFFTPNGDGINEYWRVPMLAQQYPDAFIEIFDRYGKLLYGFSASQIGWDGTYNSKRLPSTDYWFVITLPNRTIRGHFALIR
jgi:gliding motility-associated-like protein